MSNYNTPGVYVEEISKFPPSVAGVATAIPAFLGYTEKGDINVPCRISSLLEYERTFGYEAPLSVVKSKNSEPTIVNSQFVLYDSIRLFYDNGGGICWIVPVGNYSSPKKTAADFVESFKKLEEVDEVTLLLFPDAVGLDSNWADVQNAALLHASKMGDRFVILDVKDDDKGDFRDKISGNKPELCYGAAYYPYLQTSYTKSFSFADVLRYNPSLQEDGAVKKFLEGRGTTEAPIADPLNFFTEFQGEEKNELVLDALIEQIPGYRETVKAMVKQATCIPPSGAIAGIISKTDSVKGVWAAPANISLASVVGVSKFITDDEQAELNVDTVAGKSINAIRSFSGKGILVWGARTLEGNSNEWRYISVRRLFNYVEESIKKSTSWAVFSPNDANTWVKIKSQIENFLNNLWRQGALAGSRPESAFFVNVGLPATMDANDIHEGRLIVEIGLAAVRPAEFIILRFSHKVQE